MEGNSLSWIPETWLEFFLSGTSASPFRDWQVIHFRELVTSPSLPSSRITCFQFGWCLQWSLRSSRSPLAFVCALGKATNVPCATATCGCNRVKVSPRCCSLATLHQWSHKLTNSFATKRALCWASTSWSSVSHMASGQPAFWKC